PPPPPNSGNDQGQQGGAVIISEEGAVVVGSDDAPITIVEYTDFQCPFCARHLTDTYPLLLENYIETGIVRYVYKDFPLQSIHPQATIAAEAARCAGDQGAWLDMHEILFANQREWSIADPTPVFVGYAEGLGLDTAVFQSCVDSRQYQAAVEADLQEGSSFGVTGTPTFFFNGLLLAGAQPYEVFEQAIGQLLEEQGNQ
ncbi:MAG: DsbA family protein, partial [Chloroflexota bacterium]